MNRPLRRTKADILKAIQDAKEKTNIQIMNNDFSVLWPSPTKRPGEMLRGVVYLFDDDRITMVSSGGTAERDLIAILDDFTIVTNVVTRKPEIYVAGRHTNVLNKLKPEVRDTDYKAVFNSGIMLIMSDTHVFAINKFGEIRQVYKGNNVGQFGIARSMTNPNIFTVYRNNTQYMLLDLDLNKIRI